MCFDGGEGSQSAWIKTPRCFCWVRLWSKSICIEFYTFYRFAVGGCSPEEMGIGPTVAVPKLLSRYGLTVDDIDLWELNEAFAVVPLRCADVLGIDHAKMNVNGGNVPVVFWVDLGNYICFNELACSFDFRFHFHWPSFWNDWITPSRSHLAGGPSPWC